ncbi:MAG: hypothetical protein DRN95_06615, partial [Candidatus Hydrothermarchaeota archaeon]
NVTYEPTYIKWEWTDPADADLSHVMVYLIGVFQTNVSKGVQFYNATGLSPDTEYTLSTHTVDTAGNINQTWVNHTARTAIGFAWAQSVVSYTGWWSNPENILGPDDDAYTSSDGGTIIVDMGTTFSNGTMYVNRHYDDVCGGESMAEFGIYVSPDCSSWTFIGGDGCGPLNDSDLVVPFSNETRYVKIKAEGYYNAPCLDSVRISGNLSMKPDLTVTDIDTYINGVRVGQLIVNYESTIRATIKNIGNTNASGFNVSLSVNGTLIDTKTVGSLSKGASGVVEFNWTPTSEGQDELCVYADSESSTEELNETNNEKCTSVSVIAEPYAYFAPEHSTGVYCQNNTLVQIRINASVDTYGLQVDMNFDPTCVNITAVDPTNSAWQPVDWSRPHSDKIRIIGFGHATSGDNLLANITLHCINMACDCTSYLNFSEVCAWDYCTDPVIDTYAGIGTVHNGTIECTHTIPGIDLNITAIDAYHEGLYGTSQDPWFNLSNEIAATVENVGTEDAGAFNVCLYIDEELMGKRSVSGLDAGNSTTVHFEWTPIGCDCADGCSPKTYTLKAIADCDDDIIESNENNNELTRQETAYWNGYAADEPLENFVHGKLRGGLLFTTGDSVYGKLEPGESRTGTYNISLPQGAEVELARLNVYYTWVYPQGSLPQMEVKIKNQTGTYVLFSVDKKYDDRKCWGGFDLYWGNWVYDVTQYIQESGTYEITVKCTQSSGSVCPAGPGILYYTKMKQNQ